MDKRLDGVWQLLAGGASSTCISAGGRYLRRFFLFIPSFNVHGRVNHIHNGVSAGDQTSQHKPEPDGVRHALCRDKLLRLRTSSQLNPPRQTSHSPHEPEVDVFLSRDRNTVVTQPRSRCGPPRRVPYLPQPAGEKGMGKKYRIAGGTVGRRTILQLSPPGTRVGSTNLREEGGSGSEGAF